MYHAFPSRLLQSSRFGPLAQWLEQTTHNRLAPRSNRGGATIHWILQLKDPARRFFNLIFTLLLAAYCINLA